MTMWLRSTVLAAVALAAVADVPRNSQLPLRSSGLLAEDIPQTSGLRQASPSPAPVSQDDSAKPADADSSHTDGRASMPAIVGDPSQPMKPEMKVQIIRYIDGEFGKAAKALPGKPTGFTIHAGQPIDAQAYQDALRLQGTAVGVGDPVQVTQLEFEGKKIIIQLNGGAKKKFHLRDHLQIGLGGGSGPMVTSTDGTNGKGEGTGAVIILDYGKPLPDVSPDDVRHELSALIDFSAGQSAAVNWVSTLPPAFQDAVRDHKALPGMDQQTVVAAIGRPDRRHREKNQDGVETEDWIYGNPPAKTVFVTFLGDKVIRVEECGGPQTDDAGAAGGAAPTCSTLR